MKGSLSRAFVSLSALAMAVSACASAPRTQPQNTATAPTDQEDRARVEAFMQARTTNSRFPFTDADVHFMSGMIPHHAQAVRMARLAESHGARRDVLVLAQRIVVGQRDEIALMRTWLRDRGKPVPDSNATHMKMKMGDMEHDMLMPGMLSDAELAKLDSARGPAFDRLFLTYMIRHHEGAVKMVDELFASPGAGQDDVVFKLASDIYADQTTEIDRMTRMLAATPGGGGGGDASSSSPSPP